MKLSEILIALGVGMLFVIMACWSILSFWHYPQKTIDKTFQYGKIIEDDRGPVLRKAMQELEHRELSKHEQKRVDKAAVTHPVREDR